MPFKISYNYYKGIIIVLSFLKNQMSLRLFKFALIFRFESYGVLRVELDCSQMKVRLSFTIN